MPAHTFSPFVAISDFPARAKARKKKIRAPPRRSKIPRRRKNGGSRNETKSQKLLDNRGRRAFIKKLSNTVVVAQLVRASDCGSEGRGFESLLPPQLFSGAFCAAILIPPARRVSGGIFCFGEARPRVSSGAHKFFIFPFGKFILIFSYLPSRFGRQVSPMFLPAKSKCGGAKPKRIQPNLRPRNRRRLRTKLRSLRPPFSEAPPNFARL